MMTRTITTSIQLVSLAGLLLLGACSNGPKGVRIVNGGTSAYTDKKSAPISTMSAPQIGQAVIGKSFQFTRKDSTGFVVYNGDGTLKITDDQKGELAGTWRAAGNEYCETYGQGGIQECGVFKNTGDAYFAANSRLVEMKI